MSVKKPFYDVYTASEITTRLASGGGGGAVDSVFGRTGVVASANGDYTATQITNVPAGGVAAVTVQAAINELDGDIDSRISTAISGTIATNITTAVNTAVSGVAGRVAFYSGTNAVGSDGAFLFDTVTKNLSTTGDVTSAQLRTGNGTQALPAVTPSTDLDTGVFYPAANVIAYSCGNLEVLRCAQTFISTVLAIYARVPVTNSAANVSISVGSGSNQWYTNSGATGKITFTLPTGAVIGTELGFYVSAAHELEVKAGAGQTVRLAASESVSAGTASNSTVGSCIRFVAMTATTWVAIHDVGTWTIT